jgi:hypothetical protein
MADFPSLYADAISYDIGALNISEEPTVGAGPIRFRHSLRTTGGIVRLSYANLTLAQMQQIRDHWIGSDGTHRYFAVPTAIWGGAPVGEATSVFRYEEPPEEEQLGLFFNVTVALRMLFGVNLLYILVGGTAVTRTVAAFQSFAFNGNAPFILDGGEADRTSPAATLIIKGGGAAK